jgi:hypothetical protein
MKNAHFFESSPKSTKQNAKGLEIIPGVGKSIASDLMRLGIYEVADLRGKSADQLFEQSNLMARCQQDRCLLYVFRCAVYFAETSKPEAVKLKWWYWKNHIQRAL